MRALIFDLDGTLWDATGTLTALWQRELQRAGVKSSLRREDMIRGMGLGPEALAAHLAPELPAARRLPFFQHVNRMVTDAIPVYGAELYPDLVPTLRDLSENYRLMIASNCIDGYIEAFVHYAGVEAFICDFLHPGITGRPKADNIRLLMERGGIAEAAIVGDTVLDFEAAQGAGIPFIHAAYGFCKVDGAKWRIGRLSELPAVAKQIFSE